MRPRIIRSALAGLAALALVAALAGARWTAAQDATPAPQAEVAHPAHIHGGTCAALGDVVFPLTDVALAPAAETATPPAQPMLMHADEVLTSVTTVDVALADLLAGQYAINVHESAETIGTYIACGDIAGQMRLHLRSDAPAGLVIPLRELNESGYAGVAWLEPTADGKTTVTIFLAQGLIGRGPMP
jgi:hypothetical protein